MEQTTKTAEQVLQETFEHAYGTLHPLMHVQPILRAMEAYAAQRPTVAPSETKTACACKYPSYNAMTDRCTVCGKLYYKEQATPVAPDYDCECIRCSKKGQAKEWHTVGLESHSGYGGDPICDECYKELIGEQAAPVAVDPTEYAKRFAKKDTYTPKQATPITPSDEDVQTILKGLKHSWDRIGELRKTYAGLGDIEHGIKSAYLFLIKLKR